MRAIVIAGLLAATVQAQGVTAPALSAEEQVMVQAVMALQGSAAKACEALPEVQSYNALLGKAQAALKASGKSVDWRTGTLATKETP